MRLLRPMLYALAVVACLFCFWRIGHLLRRSEVTLDRTTVILEKIRRIKKINLASSFASRITPDARSNLQLEAARFYFKYVALIRVDAYVDYGQARYDASAKTLRLPNLEFTAGVVPGASFLWKAEGELRQQPALERRFTQSEEEIMRLEVLSQSQARASLLRQKAYDSCRNFFARIDPALHVEFADER